jgi:hypothetical protein
MHSSPMRVYVIGSIQKFDRRSGGESSMKSGGRGVAEESSFSSQCNASRALLMRWV